MVIPCYNQAHFLNEPIETAFAQSYSHREILVMDDGSTGGTTDMVQCHANVRYFHQTNSGLCAARNDGLRSSRGEGCADQWL